MSCSCDIYMRFWNEKYKATPEDVRHLDAFTGVRDELERAVRAARQLPYLPNDFGYLPAFEIRQRVVAAMFGSKSPADFRRRVRRLMTAAQAERVGEVLEYFGKRLHPWWVATGQPIVSEAHQGYSDGVREIGRGGDGGGGGGVPRRRGRNRGTTTCTRCRARSTTASTRTGPRSGTISRWS